MKIGWAMCGSFCTFESVIRIMKTVVSGGAEVTPVFSETAYGTDTRFGPAAEWVARAEAICGKSALHTISETEPVGPTGMFDLLIVAPATGNTLAKLAHGITDTSVTMAAKSHLRNGRPVLLAPSTNDGLSASAQNIGALMGRKHIFFVPYRQDDAGRKPASLASDMEKIPAAIPLALRGEQVQPSLLAPGYLT